MFQLRCSEVSLSIYVFPRVATLAIAQSFADTRENSSGTTFGVSADVTAEHLAKLPPSDVPYHARRSFVSS